MSADDRQWWGLLNRLDELARVIRDQSAVARSDAIRTTSARLAGAGFPTASSPFGERGMLRAPQIDRDGNVIEPDPDDLPPAHSDITGELATAIANGALQSDQCARHRRAAERLTFDAVELLERALGGFKDAVPQPAMPAAGREICVTCGGAKDVITVRGQKPHLWVQSASRCRTCSVRIARNGPADPYKKSS